MDCFRSRDDGSIWSSGRWTDFVLVFRTMERLRIQDDGSIFFVLIFRTMDNFGLHEDGQI